MYVLTTAKLDAVSYHLVASLANYNFQLKGRGGQHPFGCLVKGPTSPIEAYSCDLHVMDPVEDGPQVTCMTAKDGQQAQSADLLWFR